MYENVIKLWPPGVKVIQENNLNIIKHLVSQETIIRQNNLTLVNDLSINNIVISGRCGKGILALKLLVIFDFLNKYIFKNKSVEVLICHTWKNHITQTLA